MFKGGNTRHYKSSSVLKKMRKKFGTYTATPDFNANGLNFTSANQILEPADVATTFPMTGPFTIEFYLEVNATNKSGDRYVMSKGKVSSYNNFWAVRMVGGRFTLIMYDNAVGVINWSSSATALTEGMHRVSISYDPTSIATITLVVNGVATTPPKGGAGAGIVNNATDHTFFIGGNTYYTKSNTTYRFAGRIKNFHYSPFTRTAADMIKRQSDINKLYPVDKYSALDWTSDDGFRIVQSKTNPSRKY